MDIPKQKGVSSDEAIINSIVSDDAVSRWFELLAAQPAAVEYLDGIPEAAAGLRKIRALIRVQRILLAAIIVLTSAVILRSGHWGFFSGPVALFLVGLRLQSLKRQAVAAVSAPLILRSRTREELADITLYQLAEQYSRQYSIPSLVDKIAASSRIMRYSFLAFIIALATLSRDLSASGFFISLIVFYLAMRSFLMADRIYPRLK